MSDTKIWFITGASSGFGRAMSEHLLRIDHKVVATLRKPETLSDLIARYPPTQLLVVPVDVTNKAEITAAFARAEQVFGRIDVVFNNAGVTLTGEVESMEEVDARGIFDVNFWGAVHVTKEAVRFFREVNKPVGGRLLQVSSRLGLVGSVALGYYSASYVWFRRGDDGIVTLIELITASLVGRYLPRSRVSVKFTVASLALEGLTESLAEELDPTWNIKVVTLSLGSHLKFIYFVFYLVYYSLQVTILEPGPFRTEIAKNNYHAVPPHPAYTNPVSRAAQIRQRLAAGEMFDWRRHESRGSDRAGVSTPGCANTVPIAQTCRGGHEDKARGLQEVASTYESWTEDLYHDN
ncbi:NAD(P)-binding protein [Chiua virens]|nr:NAD(P)-binding protein [Chiua virens]